MTDKRWRQVMKNENENLTQDELERGYHFCYDWDGLLVGPCMGEFRYCNCFDDDRYRAILFLHHLDKISKKYEIELNCHADFVSHLIDRKNNKVICTLYEDCQPEFIND